MKDEGALIVPKLFGAGLANRLLALQLENKGIPFDIFDIQKKLPDKTWSCFASDVSEKDQDLLKDMGAKFWPGYTVHFPDFSRELSSGYICLESDQFSSYLERRTQFQVQEKRLQSSGQGLIAFDTRSVSLSDWGACGFQKFLGLKVRLNRPHGLDLPIVMDARVEQKEGFRFIYVLPLSFDELLVEDTRYSNDRRIDSDDFEGEIFSYIKAHFGEVSRVLKKEQAALPIPIHRPQVFDADTSYGVRGGQFHPITGYSLPWALRLSRQAALDLEDPARYQTPALQEKRQWRKSWSFYLMLNRMLFAASDAQRRQVFSRFYQLPQPLIERFYAGHLTFWDKVRLLSGKPPIPLGVALKSLLTKKWMKGFVHA